MAVEQLQDAIRAEHPEVQRIFIEAKNLVPAAPESSGHNRTSC